MKLGVLLTSVLALCLPLAPAGAASRADHDWGELRNPVLATSDRGDFLVVGQRDLDSADTRGRVAASFLRAGTNSWTPLTDLSSQARTVGIAADIAGTGRGLVAWTAGGRAYARTRSAAGTWGPQELVSRRTGIRWVTVDVNRSGDQAIGWKQGDDVYLAYRAAGTKVWKRFLGPASTQRPVVSLTERPAQGSATAAITWLGGTGAATAISTQEYAVTGTATRRADLVTAPDISAFAYDVTRARAALLVARPTPVGEGNPEDYRFRTTLYDGATGQPVTERWTEPRAGGPGLLAVDVAGGAAQAAFGRIRKGANPNDTFTTIETRGSKSTVWGGPLPATDSYGPSVPVHGLSLRIDAAATGILDVQYPDGTTAGGQQEGFFRVPIGHPRVVRRTPSLPGSAPGVVGVGLSGRSAIAWTGGTPTHPVVSIRLLPH